MILSGLVLGSKWGAISQLQYLALGASGLPIFANLTNGPAVLFGPSGGYIFGFVLGAFVSGWVLETLSSKSKTAAWVGGMAGIIAIYLFGATWLSAYVGPAGAWKLGVIPFIGIDIVKAAAASSLCKGGRTIFGMLGAGNGL